MEHHKKSGRAVFIFLVLLAEVGTLAFAQDVHFVNGQPVRWEPCIPEGLTQQIRQAAEQYKAFAPVPRVAFIDIAYPRDNEEARALAGYAVVLVTSISQDKTELPLHRVYVVANGTSAELECLVSVESVIQKKPKVIATTFGPYRCDALYLMPICAAMKRGRIFIDFAKNRSDFKLHEFQSPGPRDFSEWEEWPAPESRPSAQSLEGIIRREFPCFLAK
jgi:hypothetical protein